MIQGTDYININPWLAIESLVKSINSETIHTISLVEVVEVTKDKVSVNDLVIQKESTVPPVIYHNVPIMMPCNDKLMITYPVVKGDKGILLTCKLDISELKKTKQACKTNMSRVFDKNDSVFIPLFFNTKNLEPSDDAGVEIKYHDAVVLIKKNDIILKNKGVNFKITSDGEITCTANTIKLTCDTLKCPPVNRMMKGLQARCDALSKGMKGSATNALEYTTLTTIEERVDDPFSGIDE